MYYILFWTVECIDLSMNLNYLTRTLHYYSDLDDVDVHSTPTILQQCDYQLSSYFLDLIFISKSIGNLLNFHVNYGEIETVYIWIFNINLIK